jgi:hypothetical protein
VPFLFLMLSGLFHHAIDNLSMEIVIQ